jgi:hypothetical protein
MNAVHSHDLRVEEYLQPHVQTIGQIALQEWQVVLRDCPGLLVCVRAIEHVWLTFTAPLVSRSVASLSDQEVWALLQWNGALPGGVRFAVRLGVPCVSLQAEIAIDAETNLIDRIAETCAGFLCAWAKVHASKAEQVDALTRSACSVSVPKKPCDLPSLCREAQWPCTERADGRITVTLDVPHETFCATLTQRQSDGVRIAVELLSTDELAAPCQRALGLLLLTVSGAVRMIRTVAVPHAERSIVQCEVQFTSTPAVTEVSHALSALSVAVRLCHCELEVLRHDAAIATAYLTQWQTHHISQTKTLIEQN